MQSTPFPLSPHLTPLLVSSSLQVANPNQRSTVNPDSEMMEISIGLTQINESPQPEEPLSGSASKNWPSWSITSVEESNLRVTSSSTKRALTRKQVVGFNIKLRCHNNFPFCVQTNYFSTQILSKITTLKCFIILSDNYNTSGGLFSGPTTVFKRHRWRQIVLSLYYLSKLINLPPSALSARVVSCEL